jgi:ribosomal protein S18 acetylase RimI-like enzyme
VRHYAGSDDYRRVSDFLLAHYQPDNRDGNWLEPMWEYMHGHPSLESDALEHIGLWEVNGQVASVANYEARLGEAFFQFHPAYRHLRQAMLEHAERHFRSAPQTDGRRVLRAFVNDNDEEFIRLVRACGFERQPEHDRPLYRLAISDPLPPIKLPAGYRLQSLADECDWAKVHRVLWRGFNHPGEPPGGEDELESRRRMFDTPTARRDLKIVVATPNGDYAAFCGMFCVPACGYAYVEPVATDPDYRRMGLGRAAVLEGVRRCGELGAAVAYVGSDQAFYQALGFTPVYTSQCWTKTYRETGDASP